MLDHCSIFEYRLLFGGKKPKSNKKYTLNIIIQLFCIPQGCIPLNVGRSGAKIMVIHHEVTPFARSLLRKGKKFFC